jgi:hypothetical protein
MPLCLYYRPSFNRSVKRLRSSQKNIIGTILEALDIYYSFNCSLSEARRIAPRFFINNYGSLTMKPGSKETSGLYFVEKVVIA